MRKYFLTLLISLTLLGQANAQTDIDHKLLQDIPNCENVAYNSGQIINDLYTKQAYDSISHVVNRWEEFCGESEPIFRIKVLSQIQLGIFSSQELDQEELMSHVFTYIDRQEFAKAKNYHQYYEYYKVALGFIPLKSDFDLLTTAWAESLLQNKEVTGDARAFCLLYANNTEGFWQHLQQKQEATTPLEQVYSAETAKIKNMIDGNFGVLSGIYLPTGDLASVIGPKALIGMQFGFKMKKMQYDLTIAIRPGKAKEMYEVIHDDQLKSTDHYLGGLVGLDLSYELRNNLKRELDLVGGIAFDGFDAIEGDVDNDIKGKSINALNLNIGLGYRFYSKSMNYLGVQAKYNIVNYKNTGGTNLAGNYFSVMVTYNLFGNIRKHRALDRMNLK